MNLSLSLIRRLVLFGLGLGLPWVGASLLPGQEASPVATSDATATTTDAPVVPPPVATDTRANGSPAPTEAAAPAKPAAPERPVIIPYQEQIYQVSLSLGVDPDAGITDRQANLLLHRLQQRIESRIGQWWNCRFALSAPGTPVNRAMLAHRTEESWNIAFESTPIDKHFALTLDRTGTEFRISGVEWDRATQSTTPIQQRLTFDRRLLVDLAADLTFDLFRPLVSVDIPVEKTVEMRIRGGEFMPPDATLTPFQIGSFVTPFARHLGKNRELKRLQKIPWTMIQIEVVERSFLRGKIISAFATPMSGNRRRVEMLAIQARPVHPETHLQVIPRRNPDSPMAGYRVEILDRLETKDDKVSDRITIRTDRNGEIVIPADPSKPLRHLIVYSGAAPLAKAPVIPGHVPHLVLEAPDDAPRLNVEAETELLQSELVDIVARREVLMARARGSAKKREWDQVTELEKQIDALPTFAQFQVRIDTLRNPAIQAAKRNKDKAQESRIARMCKQITEMATEYLDPTKIKEFKTEIEEERQAQ